MRSATCLQTLHILLSFALKAARKALILCVINSSTVPEAKISFTFDNDVLRVGFKNFHKDSCYCKLKRLNIRTIYDYSSDRINSGR